MLELVLPGIGDVVVAVEVPGAYDIDVVCIGDVLGGGEPVSTAFKET